MTVKQQVRRALFALAGALALFGTMTWLTVQLVTEIIGALALQQ